MHSFTAVVAAFALLSAASGSPLYLRSNSCGALPAGSNTNNQPIEQPSGIATAAACLAKCSAEIKCQSFTFGLVDNVIKCELFSVAAASIPKQPSNNLVAYDKTCSAVPSVTPTSSNPTGKAQDSTEKQSDNTNNKPAVQQKTTENQINDQADNQVEPAKVSKAPTKPQKSTPTPTPAKQAQQTTKEQTQKQTTTSAKTCGSKPAGSGSSLPISQPTVDSVDACKMQCQANGNCKSFTFGVVNNAKTCELFNCAASSVPAPSDAAKKQALVAYDVGCSI